MPRSAFSANPSQPDTGEMIVAFEILSPSTMDRDLRWKKTAYTGLPSLTHYVVVAQDAMDVVVFTRDTGFAEQRYRSLPDTVESPELGIALPLSEIYHDTGLE
jgi:Uma2 family endonuclease